ncbi:hypothetical protein NPIL_426761 [Nephila pilipes]|uniref:Uncharacterized protein n=1 Tax=Nephila pilipes TaxID=299642 RepID=A0A8X6QI83_NEPPI|nr:hypothetical protein NPIL_426761 [Nephila pilipes]
MLYDIHMHSTITVLIRQSRTTRQSTKAPIWSARIDSTSRTCAFSKMVTDFEDDNDAMTRGGPRACSILTIHQWRMTTQPAARRHNGQPPRLLTPEGVPRRARYA